MSQVLPTRSDLDVDEDPTVVALDDADADGVFDALSPGTAQEILAELQRKPLPASRVADRVGTSLQNVRHHLTKLEDNGIVAVAGTEYSEKGIEMDVYAPAGPVVIVLGDLDAFDADVGGEDADAGVESRRQDWADVTRQPPVEDAGRPNGVADDD